MVLRLKTRESRSLPGLLKAMPSQTMDPNLLDTQHSLTGHKPETKQTRGEETLRPSSILTVDTLDGLTSSGYA